MVRSLAALLLVTSFFVSTPAEADTQAMQVRSDIVASGALVTLGDIFVDAGAAADRPIGPAPRAGATGTVSALVVQRAASAAGLTWNPDPALRILRVRGSAAADTGAASPSGAAALAIRKGDLVVLTYTAPGVRLTARTRAQSDARPGEPVKLMNMQSNRPVDALAVGPGRASANLDLPLTE